MKKGLLAIIVCIIVVIIIIGMLPRGFIGSRIIRNKLLQDNILSELGVKEECQFKVGSFLDDFTDKGNVPPIFECPWQRKNALEQDMAEMDRLENILINNGWKYIGPHPLVTAERNFKKNDLLVTLKVGLVEYMIFSQWMRPQDVPVQYR